MSKKLVALFIISFLLPSEGKSQSWIYDRCIRSTDQKIKKISAYIIPCSENDSIIYRRIELDSNSYLRQVELFDLEGKIISSSEPISHLPNSIHSKVYNYKLDKLTSIVESVDGVEQRTISYSDLPGGSKKIVYHNWLDSTDLVYLNVYEYFEEMKIENSYKIFGNDTIISTQTIFNKDDFPIQSVLFYDNKIYTNYIHRDASNQIISTTSLNPDGRIKNNAYQNTEYQKIQFKNNELNLKEIEVSPGVHTMYLEQLDIYGNMSAKPLAPYPYSQIHKKTSAAVPHHLYPYNSKTMSL